MLKIKITANILAGPRLPFIWLFIIVWSHSTSLSSSNVPSGNSNQELLGNQALQVPFFKKLIQYFWEYVISFLHNLYSKISRVSKTEFWQILF